MAASPKAKLDFSCKATAAVSKKYSEWKLFAPLLHIAANEVMRKELPRIGSLKLGIVLMSDEELLEINRNALQHDFYTDILTFEIDREKGRLEAEIYLSIDRASENALRYNVSLRNELARLVIHGMLHLAGHDDQNAVAKKRMRERERFFLRYLHSEHSIEY